MDLCRSWVDRYLPAVIRVRQLVLSGLVHCSDLSKVDTHWSLETSGDSCLEPGLCPLLDGQDADQVEPLGTNEVDQGRLTFFDFPLGGYQLGYQ